MAKPRRKRVAAPAPARRLPEQRQGPTLVHRRVAPAREWRWKTFPVYFTFALTFFLTTIVAEAISGSGNLVLLLLPAALALAAGLAHLVVTLLIVPRIKPPGARPDR